jgi:GLPGLI family protein
LNKIALSEKPIQFMKRKTICRFNKFFDLQLILLMVLFTLPFAGFSQKNEGMVKYLKTYNWTKMMASVDYLSKEETDRDSYMWGNRSEWKMYTLLYFSDSLSKYEDSDEKAERDEDTYSWRKDVFYITRDFKRQRIKDVMNMLGKDYIIEDTLIPPGWKILNDIKEISGHVCMNAFWNDTLKKQKITAWFALDIPISAGPERFCGLPGLILEIDINNGALNLCADKIDIKTLTNELDLPKKIKGKKITEADYLAIIKKHYDDRRKAEEPPFWGIRY